MTNQGYACLICEFEESEVVLEYDNPDPYEFSMGVSAENYFRKWVRCANCNFHYSTYSRDSTLFNKIYEEKYRNSGS